MANETKKETVKEGEAKPAPSSAKSRSAPAAPQPAPPVRRTVALGERRSGVGPDGPVRFAAFSPVQASAAPAGLPAIGGVFDRVRTRIAAKAVEASGSKAKEGDKTLDLADAVELARQAFSDQMLGLHLLEWVKDHKGKAAEPDAFLDQGAKVILFLASV